MSGASMLGVLVTHGRLGEELKRTAESILGPQENLMCVSNVGVSHLALVETLDQALARRDPPGSPAVIFVDLAAGSCGHACHRIGLEHPELLVACGVNLPMLIEFLHHRSRVARAELCERLRRRGRESIECRGWNDVQLG